MPDLLSPQVMITVAAIPVILIVLTWLMKSAMYDPSDKGLMAAHILGFIRCVAIAGLLIVCFR